MTNLSLRNIAVIAHVDHGKTTLVDAMLKQTNVFRANQEQMNWERIMDSNELERERGITILAKNCAINYLDTKINIIDTPGHADFSGEVERTLGMADGALLIVDAQEGPMPQTRFVLKLALKLGLKVIVVINKIDKKLARVNYTLNRLESLFLDLATQEDQLNFPILYGIGRVGKVFNDLPDDIEQAGSVKPLLDAIIEHVPAPTNSSEGPFRMLVSSLDYDTHIGRLILGKIDQGVVKSGSKVVINNDPNISTIDQVFVSKGLGREPATQVSAGDIVILSGVAKASIGMTLNEPGQTTIIPSASVSEPTLHLTIGSNTSPFNGKEGQYTTSRQIGERLERELENNVSLRVEALDNGKFKVSGRGELHLSILLETMRREGYELEVGKPEVITRTNNGVQEEPIEEVDLVVPQEFIGTINQEFGKRQALLIRMDPISDATVEFVYHVPTRAIIGLRSVLLTLTKGTAVLNSQLIGYQAVGQPLPKLRKGVLLSAFTGKAVEYGLRTLKGRGMSFINPGTDVYQGMIVGINNKDDDIDINVCKEKNLTNHRSKSHQGITQLAPDLIMSLEQSLDFLEPDELLEITPTSLRLRKKILIAEQRFKTAHTAN